jgi:hypothetical protein
LCCLFFFGLRILITLWCLQTLLTTNYENGSLPAILIISPIKIQIVTLLYRSGSKEKQ